MTLPRVQTVTSKDRDITRLSRQLADLSNALGDLAILDGRLIDNVTVTTAAFDVAHGLGRTYRGYVVARVYTTACSLAEAATQPDAAKNIRLTSSAASKVALWVF